MINDPRFPVEAWHLREIGLDTNMLAQSESLFALSNGHIGLRGNLDEGDPAGLPGTYLNSFYESRPLPYAEAGYGYPESGQSIVNVTDGKLIRLLVEDEPFDLRYGDVRHHERILDLRGGFLHRVVEWIAPSGRIIKVRSTRMVSLTQRAIVAIDYEVEAVGLPTRVVIQSELVANEETPKMSDDPRVAAVLGNPLEAEEHSLSDMRAMLIHHTRASKLRMAAVMDHVVHGPKGWGMEAAVHEDWARIMVGTTLQPGEKLRLTKYVAYGWSSQRSMPALRDQVDGALTAAMRAGWDQLIADQRAALDLFWQGADVEIDGDPDVQQAVRVALFHVFQAAARAEQRAIAAKGLTGPGYDGHAFWDTESFVLPLLSATAPHAAADALRWRLSTIDLARERAQTLHLRGAAFPWRTIRGQECSAYWPAGTAAVHINADIAVAAMRHVRWTGDQEFERDVALPLLVETARLWHSLGYEGEDERFHLDGVTGPDEYSAIVDDNTYTNLMAAENLTCAVEVSRRHAGAAAALDVEDQEIARWERAASTMAVSWDTVHDIPAQDRTYNQHERGNFQTAFDLKQYPLLLHVPYFTLYRKQVSKQADLVLAMHWCGNQFTADQKARAFEYYEAVTVRDSSLSACTQAVIAAEVGQLELARDYLAEAAFMDLHDIESNTGDGLHIASLAGAWIAIVAGLGGMRDHGGQLSFRPQLPPALTGLRFRLRWRDALIRVEVTPDNATYSIEDGAHAGVDLVHEGTAFTVRTGAPVTLSINLVKPLTARPTQPLGRVPRPADGPN
jgi:alpha,alpha-trehalose phosphorylase